MQIKSFFNALLKHDPLLGHDGKQSTYTGPLNPAEQEWMTRNEENKITILKLK